MPDQDGRFTDSEKQRFNDWIVSKWPEARHACPICENTLWHLSEKVAVIPAIHPEMMFFGGPSYACAAAMCTRCGYMRFFNAVATGIIQQPAADKEAGNAN